jgi:hypothetical protein
MNEAPPAEWQEFEPFKTLYVIVMDFRAKVTAAIFFPRLFMTLARSWRKSNHPP